MMATKKQVYRGVSVSANDIVSGLIDHIIKLEKRIDAVQEDLRLHLELIAESRPTVTPDGIRFDAGSGDLECLDTFKVIVAPVSVEPNNP